MTEVRSPATSRATAREADRTAQVQPGSDAHPWRVARRSDRRRRRRARRASCRQAPLPANQPPPLRHHRRLCITIVVLQRHRRGRLLNRCFDGGPSHPNRCRRAQTRRSSILSSMLRSSSSMVRRSEPVTFSFSPGGRRKACDVSLLESSRRFSDQARRASSDKASRSESSS